MESTNRYDRMPESWFLGRRRKDETFPERGVEVAGQFCCSVLQEVVEASLFFSIACYVGGYSLDESRVLALLFRYQDVGCIPIASSSSACTSLARGSCFITLNSSDSSQDARSTVVELIGKGSILASAASRLHLGAAFSSLSLY
jgi:hypothetical protein